MIDVSFVTGYKSHTKYRHMGKNTPTKCHKCSIMIEDGQIFVTNSLSLQYSYTDRIDDYSNSTYKAYDTFSCRKCYNEYRLNLIKHLNEEMSSKL